MNYLDYMQQEMLLLIEFTAYWRKKCIESPDLHQEDTLKDEDSWNREFTEYRRLRESNNNQPVL